MSNKVKKSYHELGPFKWEHTGPSDDKKRSRVVRMLDYGGWLYIGETLLKPQAARDPSSRNLKNLAICDGRGIMICDNGARFDGYWSDNKINGYGRYIYATAPKTGLEYYEGYFKDAKRAGQGDYFYSSGIKYSGQWKDDKYHGKGKKTWPDGRSYEG